jgi:hypothetical protein
MVPRRHSKPQTREDFVVMRTIVFIGLAALANCLFGCTSNVMVSRYQARIPYDKIGIVGMRPFNTVAYELPGGTVDLDRDVITGFTRKGKLVEVKLDDVWWVACLRPVTDVGLVRALQVWPYEKPHALVTRGGETIIFDRNGATTDERREEVVGTRSDGDSIRVRLSDVYSFKLRAGIVRVFMGELLRPNDKIMAAMLPDDSVVVFDGHGAKLYTESMLIKGVTKRGSPTEIMLEDTDSLIVRKPDPRKTAANVLGGLGAIVYLVSAILNYR